MRTDPKKHLWRVGYSRFPKDEKSGYKHNCLVNVAASTIQEAMKVVSDRYPDAAVWSVNHQGMLWGVGGEAVNTHVDQSPEFKPGRAGAGLDELEAALQVLILHSERDGGYSPYYGQWQDILHGLGRLIAAKRRASSNT